ncbi:MAG: hypothetical protein OIF50_07040 [Flavobacteriaceae bacterium]|nr:hypothetical protein [Flavobacteriaceae bacterium]
MKTFVFFTLAGILLFSSFVIFVLKLLRKKVSGKLGLLLLLVAGVFFLIGGYYLWTDVIRPQARTTGTDILDFVKEHGVISSNPYKEDGIDPFYWEDNWAGYAKLPLIKPYYLGTNTPYKVYNSNEDRWSLRSPKYKNINKGVIGVSYIGIDNYYIYGHKFRYEIELSGGKTTYSEAYYFVVDTKHDLLHEYKIETLWEQALDSLELRKNFYYPDDIYRSYKMNPVLPWFPEEIKQQLEAVKAKKE